MLQAINDELSKLTPEQHNQMLDMFKAALIASGAKHCSLSLITNKHQPAAQCDACKKWWAIEELRAAGKCPDCGNVETFCVEEVTEPPNGELNHGEGKT